MIKLSSTVLRSVLKTAKGSGYISCHSCVPQVFTNYNLSFMGISIDAHTTPRTLDRFKNRGFIRSQVDTCPITGAYHKISGGRYNKSFRLLQTATPKHQSHNNAQCWPTEESYDLRRQTVIARRKYLYHPDVGNSLKGRMEGEVLVMIPQTVRLGANLNYLKAGKQICTSKVQISFIILYDWAIPGTHLLHNGLCSHLRGM